MMSNTDEELDEWEERYVFLLDELIKQALFVNFLYYQLVKARADILKLVDIERNTQQSIKFAIPRLKEIVESYDGLQEYLSSNITRRIGELEKRKPIRKSKYD